MQKPLSHLAAFTTIEWLSFLIDVQADRVTLMTQSCHDESEAANFNLKVAHLRELFLTLAQDEAAAAATPGA